MNSFNIFINMIITELEMEIKTRAKYLSASISDFVVFTCMYLAVLFFSNTAEINRDYHTNNGVMLILIGYMFWTLGVMAMDLSTQTIESDAKAGILESELQSSFPLWFLMLIRVWILIILTSVYLLIIGTITGTIAGVSISTVLVMTIKVVVIAILSNLGMFGVGLIFGAGSILFKSVGTWSSLLQTGILLVSNVGAIYSSNIQSLIPFSLGIEIARLNFIGLKIPMRMFLVYGAVNLAYLVIGIFIFNSGVERERKVGSFERF